MTEKKTKTEELLEKISKTEELLEKISKNLEDPNKGIATDIERELQIDLAKLQADSARMSEPKINETKPNETKSKKIAKINVTVALGIICILLIASLGGAMAYYTLTLNDKNNQITSANNKINQLNAAIAAQNATIADRNNTIVSLNANITDLTNQENQLRTWLNGNETLLGQTQMWLNGNVTLLLAENITSYEAQISSLNDQITQLKIWLSGNITAYQNELIQYNNYVADHSHTDEDYNTISTQNTNLTNQVNDLNSILNLENSTVWINNQTISQPAGQYTNWTEPVNYAGYVSVEVQSSNVPITSSTYVALTYSAYGVSFAPNETAVNVGGVAVFPVLPSNVTVFVGNGNSGYQGGASETITITYFY